jgi:hypothetical protein
LLINKTNRTNRTCGNTNTGIKFPSKMPILFQELAKPAVMKITNNIKSAKGTKFCCNKIQTPLRADNIL